jgi:hypothetical protein
MTLIHDKPLRLRIEIEPAPQGTRQPMYEAMLKRALALADAQVQQGDETANKKCDAAKGK